LPRMMAVMLLSGLATLQTVQAQAPASNNLPEHSDTVVTRADDFDRDPYATALVAANQLRLPDKVIKELQRSNTSLRHGDLRGSTEHLQRAVALEPDLALTHNALGSRYAELKQFENALAEFNKALDLNPRYRLAMDNAAVVLCLQFRFAEAGPFARRALQVEPQSHSSQYLLGGILVQQRQYTDEATALLAKAAARYPRAWLFLAKASLGRGNHEQAVEELKQYLRCPSAIEIKVQNALAMLEAQQQAEKNSIDNFGPG
jgi:tetratricopeptide (TPR) repeat protein